MTEIATTGVSLNRRTALQSDRTEVLRRMIEIRVLEDRVRELFFEGLVPGTTHTAQGQEAVAVGIGLALRPTDTVACTYRGHGLALALGVEPKKVFGEILGRRIGCIGGMGGSMHLSDISVGLLPTMAIVGAGIPIAAGAALTAQVLGTDDIAVSVFGDGASNIGAFHEGLNLAAIWQLPVVFVCENNHYGEYSRIDKTTPIADIAVRAESYGMPSAIVDGQDVDAVHTSMRDAAQRARDGGGPTLLEMKTYRYAGHSRSDEALYRPEGELDSWLGRDPIDGFARVLAAEGVVADDSLEALRAEVAEHVQAQLTMALDSPRAGAADMFRHVQAP